MFFSPPFARSAPFFLVAWSDCVDDFVGNQYCALFFLSFFLPAATLIALWQSQQDFQSFFPFKVLLKEDSH